MRRFPTVTILLATTLCCVSPGLSFEYDEAPRSSYVSRRAIDGTRGRKYFDPKEDGFFEDYGFDRGQYHGSEEKTVIEDLRSNVPGEPGVDYPAYTTIPKTSFSCNNSARGYYADEEAGCQVFHVCDGGLVSSFLCPVGSLFSQRLLTCDWWSKVPCSQSQQFYEDQSFDSETLRQTLADQMNLHEPQDQHQETDRTVPVFADVRPNENQLTHAGEKKQRGRVRGRPSNDFYQTSTEKSIDSPIVRVKIIDNEKRTRVRGHSSFSSSDGTSQGHQRRHPSHGAPSTEPSVTMNLSIAGESRASSISLEATPTPYHETSSQEYQDNAALNAFPGAVLKKGLEESINDTHSQPEFGIHNSAFEYDDMEGKESIGLVNSQAERNLERQEEANGKPVTASKDLRPETTSVEYSESATDATVTDVTTQSIEDLAKESIGLIVSKIQEQLQLFDGEKAPVTENIYNSTEQKAEETVTPAAEVITSQYQSEATTALPSSETANTLENGDIKNKNEKVKIQTQKSQVRKMSGFRINVIEKRRKTTTAPLIEEEITSPDYHQLLNSSDTSITSTVSPTTVTSSEEFPTTLSNNVRRVSDAVEESNTPYGVTLSLNDASYDRSLSRDEIIRELISHQRQPVDSRNLGSQTKYDQNQASDSTESVRNNQNYRTYHSQFSNLPRNRDRYQSQVTATTFRTFPTLPDQFVSTTTAVPHQTYDDYQTNDESSGLTNYQTNQDDSRSTSYQPHLSTTTPAPQKNYDNYQSQDRPIDFTNYQVPQDESHSTRYQFLVPTTPSSLQNIDISQEQAKPLDFVNYQSQKHESHSTRYQHFVPSTTEAPQQNYDYYQNQEKQEDLINYSTLPREAHSTKYHSYVSSTTPIPQQNYDYFQNQDKLEDYSTRSHESHSTKYHSYVSSTTPIPQQNYDYFQNQDKQEDVNYQTQPHESKTTKYQSYVPTTTSIPPQNYGYYQNQDKQEDVNYQTQPHESKSTSYQPSVSSTTPIPLKNFVNYKNHQNEPEVPTNHRVNDETENFRHPKKFVSTTVRNLLSDDDIRDYQNQQLSRFNTYRNRPIVSSTSKYSQSLLEEPKGNENHRNPQSLPEDFRDYPVNYQTHHYPENFGNYQLGHEQSNENPVPQNFENHQTTNNEQSHQNEQVVNNVKETQKNINYPDYQNYDSTEDLIENTSFGNFGVRLNSKNQNTNSIKSADQRPNISSEADAQSINSGLQGKTANFLVMMRQLVKTDRLPRPFAQNKNKINQNFINDFTQSTDNNNNNLNQLKSIIPNDLNVFNQNNTGTLYHNTNYNDNLQQNHTQDQYVIVDEFAAPRLVPFVNNIQTPNSLSNIFLHQVSNSNEALPSSELNNRQNISDQRQGRILNYKSTTVSIPQISTQTTLNPYNIQSTSHNSIPVSGNQNFVPIQPDYSEYNVGNVPVPNEDLLPPKESEPQYIDYFSEQSTQSSIENTRIPTNNFSPLLFDFSYEQTTEQPVEQTHFPSINLPAFKNTQPPVDFGIGQNFQETVQTTAVPNISFQTPQTSSFDFGFHHHTTPSSVEKAAVSNNDVPISSNTQSQTIDYDFRPTALPSSKNQDIETADQRFNNFNVTRMVTTTKTTVETEFIPSLSFDFGSDEGRQKYLEALEKGLVSNDESRNANLDTNTSASANVDQHGEKDTSEKSDVMDNFKDTTDVMSGTE